MEWDLVKQTTRTAMDFAPDQMFVDFQSGQEYYTETLEGRFRNPDATTNTN
jgi:hypothetical protein